MVFINIYILRLLALESRCLLVIFGRSSGARSDAQWLKNKQDNKDVKSIFLTFGTFCSTQLLSTISRMRLELRLRNS